MIYVMDSEKPKYLALIPTGVNPTCDPFSTYTEHVFDNFVELYLYAKNKGETPQSIIVYSLSLLKHNLVSAWWRDIEEDQEDQKEKAKIKSDEEKLLYELAKKLNKTIIDNP
jgi:hypothetical protein